VTLLITAVTRDYAVQVADGRLTVRGAQPGDIDTISKSTYLACADGVAGIAFTGLATATGFNTSQWTAAALSDAGAEADHRLVPTLEQFRQRLSNEIWKLPIAEEDRRLTFHVGGFVHPDRPARGFAAILSNVDHDYPTSALDTPTREFSLQPFYADSDREDVALLLIGGVDAAVTTDEEERLYESAVNRVRAEAFVSRSVAVVRRASTRRAARGLIGRDCISLIVRRDGSAAESAYHPDGRDPRSHSAAFVRSVGDGHGEYAIWGYEEEHRDERGKPIPAAVPKVGRNKPCPCGSGKKYKRCHGATARPAGRGWETVLGPTEDDLNDGSP
jgi:hypothetical protein